MRTVCEQPWQARKASFRLQEMVAFRGDDLILGSGTVLLKTASSPSNALSFCADRSYDRMIALLVVAARGRLARASLGQLDAVLDEWRRGDRATAAIRLAFARLPTIRDLGEAHALFLAETVLDAGLSANELLKELGYAGSLSLLKDYRTQPRVPGGSGRESGQWTTDASGLSLAPAATPAAFKPIADGHGTLKPTPVFLRPGDGDAEEQDADEKARRLLDDTVEERIREGRPLPKEVPGGFEIVPSPELAPAAPPRTPSVGTADPSTPQTGPVPLPVPIPVPSGDGPSSGNRPREDEGPACPAPQPDRPRGPNANADLFEWQLSQVVNPLNPTPKALPSTPSVASLAYYLATPTPDGKTSYDDCKKDDTPIAIPGVRRGDLFEFKAQNFGWILSYTGSEAYNDFHEQVRRQNLGVINEGLGREVFYCFDTHAVADRAFSLLHDEFPRSHFLKCD